jgi:hypothetical protein
MAGECIESSQNGGNGHFGEYSNSDKFAGEWPLLKKSYCFLITIFGKSLKA